MSALKEMLEKSHRSKNKAEIAGLLKNLQTILTPTVYAGVSGYTPEELAETATKAEMLDVLEDFKTAYKPGWDANIAQAPVEVLRMVFDRMQLDEMNFSTQNAADADFVAQLGDIDFANLIGGPLDAAVNAQNNASMSTVNFIQEVGFKLDDPTNPNSAKSIRMVDFSYKKTNPDHDPSVPGSQPILDVDIKVPFISILNVPSLRIETVDIDFNVELKSVYTKNVSNSLGINASAKGGWGPVKFKVSASYRRSASTGVKVEKKYTLGVKVKATNDEMPAGLEKVLNLLAA